MSCLTKHSLTPHQDDERTSKLKEKAPFLSIVVPAYNVEKYIRQCVDSILAQSFTDFELLLVDDGSKDSTGEICDMYAEQDSRVRVIHKENGGLVSARKAGLTEARGEYAAYVDGDDWVSEEMFGKLCGCAVEQNADVVIADYYASYEDKNIKTTQNMRTGRYTGEQICEEIYPNLICKGEYFSFGFFPCVWGKIFKRELLLEKQMQVDDAIHLGEDAACFYPLLLKTNSIYYLKEQYLCYYRIRQNSMSHSVKKSYYTEEILMLLRGMQKQFIQETEWADTLQEQLCLYASYMIDNMLTPWLDFKTMFFSKTFRQQVEKLALSETGQMVIAYGKNNRLSSRMKRMLKMLEKDSFAARAELYLFTVYERMNARRGN